MGGAQGTPYEGLRHSAGPLGAPDVPDAPAARAMRVAATVRPAADDADAPAGTAPDPRLAADDVIAIVLDALARAGDRPDAAGADGARSDDARSVALVYAFSSPANRAAAGSLERFEEMVRDDAFRPLLGHRRVARGALKVAGERATQRVLVTTALGERVAYTFTLARQAAGAFRGCWMTESVTREAPSRLAAAYSA